jgi:hypothetical protein
MAILLAAGSLALSGQRVLVYSEYQRVRPDGEVVKADRVERRREILSPAVARNAWATFRVSVGVPSGSPYTLHIAQNPENYVQTAFYQEEYARQGDEWAPDRVKPVELPVNAVLSEGQKVQTYLLDLFVPETAAEGRFRLEVQLYAEGRWVIYPLEVRVTGVAAQEKEAARGPLAAAEARADASVTAALRAELCGRGMAAEKAEMDTARAFVARNARQDLRLAKARARESGREMVEWQMIKAGGWASKAALCESRGEAPGGAEWWLRARGYLYQGLAVK